MDHDDPGNRIPGLEGQPAALRDFVAQPRLRFTTVLKFAMFSLVLPVGLLVAVLTFPQYLQIEALVFFVGAWVIGGVALLWYLRRRLVIHVASDALTVDKRPGDVFSFGDAQLGPWTHPGNSGKTKGTVIHLWSGPHCFVLGGRDRRNAPGTRFDAPPVGSVDAWTTSPLFDDLLTMVERLHR
jgi:hypothetical protein